MKKTNKKGFTIVELVIVIAVIAILAAVLIPTFSGVVTKAKQSSALQAARNAQTQYLADFDYSQGTPKTAYYILAETYYFTVTDGKINVSSATTTAPTTGELLTAATMEWTTLTAPAQNP